MNQQERMMQSLFKGFGQKETQLDKVVHVKTSGGKEPFDLERLKRALQWACAPYPEVNRVLIFEEVISNLFDGMSPTEIDDTVVMAATSFIELDPAYGYVAARLLLKKLHTEVTGTSCIEQDVCYKQMFVDGINRGIAQNIFDKRIAQFNLEMLAEAVCPERDNLFDYMGLRTLYERYFMKDTQDNRFELPQSFWMRVAMGVALNEDNKEERAIEFYHLISQMRYVPSTPTLLHSALTRPQLSSCFLGTVNDDLKHIFKCIGDNAQLSKWSGGVAYDWTNIRATGAFIKSIKTESQGVIPFLKIANDTTAAINRSGKRRSAAVVYLETWHYDVEDFLDLRKNTGDDRRRTHDINTANWIPDLFMKRIEADGNWTLFSPEEVPELHDLYGHAFEERYIQYEQEAARGNIALFKVISAKGLWRKMLTRLFETGHPWITFKDASNIRSPQDHAGVVHSSNLCTEITLNTSGDETAVCNLGSVNMSKHIKDGAIDFAKLAESIKTAVRMLDNVIDINFYPTDESENANLRHRPIGLGLMGLQDALYQIDVAFDDERSLDVVDHLMEFISYHAIGQSAELAKERGAYQSYKGSKWDRNIFPHDTLELLEQERRMPIEVKRGGKLDWAPIREKVKQYGMRNSNTMAIAPTATISNIAGCFPCIEPIYRNMYVKANMSGEFTVINKYLIEDLKACGLWDEHMRDQIKYYDGNIQQIAEIPEHLKHKYKEVFAIDPLWLVKLTAARAKWIDQSQSHNVFMEGVSGKLLSDVYFAGWKAGMKTFYYLRTLGASQIEKSTLDAKKFGFTQKRQYATPNGADQSVQNGMMNGAAPIDGSENGLAESEEELSNVRACALSDDPACDVCQ